MIVEKAKYSAIEKRRQCLLVALPVLFGAIDKEWHQVAYVVRQLQ